MSSFGIILPYALTSPALSFVLCVVVRLQMLDLCGEKGVTSMVEVIPMDQVGGAVRAWVLLWLRPCGVKGCASVRCGLHARVADCMGETGSPCLMQHCCFPTP